MLPYHFAFAGHVLIGPALAQASPGGQLTAGAGDVNLILSLTSVIVGIIGGVLGGLSIWLAVKFYQMSNTLYNAMQQTMRSIEASSKTTEATTRDYTGRLVEAMIVMASENMKTSVIAAENQAKDRIRAKLFNVNPQLQRDLLGEIEAAFAPALRGAEKLQRLTSKRDRPGASNGFAIALDRVGIVLAARQCLRLGAFRPSDCDLGKKPEFLSVKWLHEKKFAQDLAMREALQIALDKSLLLTERIANPRNPDRPVLTCKLNQAHPLVAQALGS
jgi:hypothetical protein